MRGQSRGSSSPRASRAWSPTRAASRRSLTQLTGGVRVGHGPRGRRDAPRPRKKATVRADHGGRTQGEPRPRRDHHEGSAELPAGRNLSAPDFKDHFSGHAGDYARYRPSYPPELFRTVSALVTRHERCWDAGNGNGQAAVGLAEHFAEVVATDASADQIAHAIAAPARHVSRGARREFGPEGRPGRPRDGRAGAALVPALKNFYEEVKKGRCAGAPSRSGPTISSRVERRRRRRLSRVSTVGGGVLAAGARARRPPLRRPPLPFRRNPRTARGDDGRSGTSNGPSATSRPGPP